MSGMARKSALLLAAHATQYLLWILSWVFLGRYSVNTGARWLLFAWAGTLAALVPARALNIWLEGSLFASMGAAIKARLFSGALKLNPNELRHCGLGSFLAQVLESEAVETLALTGGIAAVLAAFEICIAGWILSRYAIVLAAWCAVSTLPAVLYFLRLRRWTEARMQMSGEIVERMMGHRTRLAQQAAERRNEGEAEMLETYMADSGRLDRAGTALFALLPRGWLLVGFASVAPAMSTAKGLNSSAAVLLGGVMLAYVAFKRLGVSLSELVAACVAAKRMAPLFANGSRDGDFATQFKLSPRREAGMALEARDLSFRHSAAPAPVLRFATLLINEGDRILIEGPSGGGKTTLASLLAGLRKPDSGLLLLNGLDIHTLGHERWRKSVAAAPQFHENHIVTETLAFNLLMARGWPPQPGDIEEAEAVCRELGLGPLLERMPGGIFQMIGDGGWQLSHGERSRIFIARALLQRAEMVILDESFAALDPETLSTALTCALRRANTLIVVAHP
jgi:ATP-binding cassette subfamily B protein